MEYRCASLTDLYLPIKSHCDRMKEIFNAQIIFFQVQSHVTQKTRKNIKNPAQTNLDIIL